MSRPISAAQFAATRGTKDLPTIERLNEAFAYDRSTGALISRASRGRARAGDVCGRTGDDGYVEVRLDGKLMRAHRIIWAMCHGEWPVHDIDHRDGNKSNNRIENLRECTLLENMQNYPVPSTNKSGFIGVSRHAASGRWQVHIRAGRDVNGKRIRLNLGYFNDVNDAAEAYAKKKLELHHFSPIPRSH